MYIFEKYHDFIIIKFQEWNYNKKIIINFLKIFYSGRINLKIFFFSYIL